MNEIRVVIKNAPETHIDLGPAAIESTRRELIVKMARAQGRAVAAFDALPFLNEAQARPALEELVGALREARELADALWWLAPEYDDGEES